MNTQYLRSIKPLTFAGVAMLAVALFATSADAAPVSKAPSIAVTYGDLDLNTADGAQTLYVRIVAAAKQVCPSDVTRDLRVLQLSHRCRREAIAHAVQDVNNPQLAALYVAHVGHG